MNYLALAKDWISGAVSGGIQLYQEHERVAAPLTFLGGVTYDTLTLTRIDRLFENIIILMYLSILGAVIVLYGRSRRGTLSSKFLRKWEELFPMLIQFLMGGLLSVYTIFYFRSTTLSISGIYLLLLLCLLVANEFLADRLRNLNLLVVLYFFVWFSFCVFFVPVLVGRLGDSFFYFGGSLSLLPTALVVYLLYRPKCSQMAGRLVQHAGSIILMACLIVFLYAMNLIPPIPLSLQEGGAFNKVEREGSTYTLTYDKPAFYELFEDSADPVYWNPGSKVYFFASVFAPTEFRAEVRHQWQWYQPSKSKWVTTDDIGYEIRGGREGGYRGYTHKSSVKPGHWRVNVLTGSGRILGRVDFEIVEKPEDRTLDFINRTL
ncbi:MAG: DUF2914 domain-containing protein [bacterium]